MKRKKPKEPPVPAGRNETVRQQIMAVLEGNELSAKDISGEVRISEKEVYDHLYHIQKSIHTSKEYSLVIMPAECKKCGFVYAKRDRLKKPGKCPVCRGQAIREPLFSIR